MGLNFLTYLQGSKDVLLWQALERRLNHSTHKGVREASIKKNRTPYFL